MIMDRQNLVSDAQNLAQIAGTYLSTDAIDLYGSTLPTTVPGGWGNVLRDAARGQAVPLFAQVVTTFTSGGAPTLTINLVQADNAALSTNLEILQSSGALALATLVQGYRSRLQAPPVGFTRRFIGFQYVIATATVTAGAITAGVANDIDTSPGVIR